MPSQFFTNDSNNSLLQKFQGVFDNMTNLHAFHAVVGYFRASGYFAIRENLLKLKEVKILVGIDVDSIVAHAQRGGFDLFKEDELTQKEFAKWLYTDIKEAKYSKNVEDSIIQFIEDIASKKIELRASKDKKLHAKIYVFLPDGFNEHKDGRVIMGSSNLTSAGLGIKHSANNYEFNVELRGYEDVMFAESEFQRLWQASTPILPESLQNITKKTYLEKEFSPFEVYIKFLIEYFGKNVEYDPESVGDLPTTFKKLSYQVDAVNQGFKMLEDHNGFFLADVVGTGKTVIAAMLAKRFIIANGTQKTRILIVYPPALEKNWRNTFKLFNIDRYTHFISNGSLNKILDEDIKYASKEEYDLILVDEAHKFRNHRSTAFQNLQIICKSGRIQNGMIEGNHKKIVLISATPLNNHPRDIYYLIQLFQNARSTSLPNVPNLQRFFNPYFEDYERLKRLREPEGEEEKKAFYEQIRIEIKRIYADIRENVIYPITIRRTRTDLRIEQYQQDLDLQGIKFPEIADPIAIEYKLGLKLEKLFYTTIGILTNENLLIYARYQAIRNLKPEIKDKYYEQADSVSLALAGIMKTMMVKRLESSFSAFKISLNNFQRATKNMIKMFENNRIFIAPDLDINKLLDEGWSDEEIETRILEISEEHPNNRVFETKDFEEDYLGQLQSDAKALENLCNEWNDIKSDPKWDAFALILKNELFSATKNLSGKLVIFSESKDTTNYLFNQLKNNGFDKVLSISADNRKQKFDIILENFDANHDKEKKNDYDIILTTEVLAEGVNLHRSNIIVNYDTPWNATRLMQRIGRVNRIGSLAKCVYNYNFYPSAQGNEEIQLRKTSYMKLQGFHSAFGEDSRIYTIEEVVEQFKMYKDGMPEDEDVRLRYLDFLRNFMKDNPDEFRRIKKLPPKARTAIKSSNSSGGTSIAFMQNDVKKEVYFINTDNKAMPLRFEEAARIFEATIKEPTFAIPDFHFEQINKGMAQFENDVRSNTVSTLAEAADQRTNTAKKFLRSTIRPYALTEAFEEAYRKLMPLLEEGTYANLVNDLEKIRKKNLNQQEVEKAVIKLSERYVSKLHTDQADPDETEKEVHIEYKDPEIIISESFI